MLHVFIQGFLLGASLIMAIGLQNAFVLRQGIKHSHIFATALTASLIDATLIFSGVFGFGILIQKAPLLLDVMTYGGAVFLFVYGIKSFIRAFHPQALDENSAAGLLKQDGLKETMILLLAFSLLNPHVYLDTVILIGGLSAAQGDIGKLWFGGGAAMASFVWFFALAYAGKMLAPVFAKPRAWQVLDVVIGLVMLAIAFGLIWNA